jgi:hypothetical protein
MNNHDKLIADVAQAVAADPLIAPQLLQAVSTGLTTFADVAKRRSDSRLAFAVTVASALPARRADWDTQNKQHATVARIMFAALNLHVRKPSSGFERALSDFVKTCDAEDPSGSANHYAVLLGEDPQ